MRHLTFLVAQPLRFQRTRRLTDAREFQAVFGGRVKKVAGVLIVWGVPNELPHWRLGLSIGKRVGNAVARNQAKRLVREAFRMVQHELPRREGEREVGGEVGEMPRGYDIVVSVRGPEGGKAGIAWTLDEFQRQLVMAARGIHKEWERRAAREAQKVEEDGGEGGEGGEEGEGR